MDRTEAGVRAQTGEKPGGGYYTGSERITLQKFSLGRITTLPSSVFGNRIGGSGGAGGGGAVGGGGGAIVVRPQVSLVDRAQTLQIQQTQQSVGFLQRILDVIRVRVQDLTNGINNVGRLLQFEGQVEQNNLLAQQETERRLNERRIREGRENSLERKIQAAIAKPLVNLQKKVADIFGRIKSALITLFFGWLTNEAINTFKAFAIGDTKKLNDIKDRIIKNVVFSLRSFGIINRGFGFILRAINSLTLKISSLVARIILAPFKLLGKGAQALKGIVGLGRGAQEATQLSIPGLRAAGTFAEEAKGGFGLLRGLGKGGSKLLPGIGLGLNASATAMDIKEGNVPGAIANAVATAGSILEFTPLAPLGLGMNILGTGAGLYYDATFNPKKQEQSTKTKSKSNPKTPKTPPKKSQPTSLAPSSSQPLTSQPQTPLLTPQSMSFDFDKTESTIQQPSTSSSKTSSYGMINFDALQQKMQDQQNKTSSTKIESPPKQQTPVGTLPEPKPNIILAKGDQNRPQISQPTPSDPINDVPLIQSGNTDNFYVLYSQLNYNVVM